MGLPSYISYDIRQKLIFYCINSYTRITEREKINKLKTSADTYQYRIYQTLNWPLQCTWPPVKCMVIRNFAVTVGKLPYWLKVNFLHSYDSNTNTMIANVTMCQTRYSMHI